MNKPIRINLDGKECTARPGQTILEVARENNIFIPTFCQDDRLEPYGACGMCVVEVEGNPKLVKSCATEVTPNMIVHTDTPRVTESRKTNLELLLSNHTGDCRPPCARACPAQTDCQGYVGLISQGKFREALELIKERIPLPASIGRVCPHPCETECRRGLVEEPIAIANLKRFAGDLDLAGEAYLPTCDPDTGKKVAIIGAGPYGLSMAYFLREKGHAVTVFEAMPRAGGMLRYGVPEYRLSKQVLDQEIDLIRKMGVEIHTNTRVGEDISFEAIRRNFDAVCIGIGAWKSTGVRCPGEDLPGVMGGIEFLGKVQRNEPFVLGKHVVVVGGGNTAMDACRTAIRMGAERVTSVYRRTIEEMPAEEEEIRGAQEEGVIFKNLTNPLEIHAGPDGRAASMTLQIMELGEPDASGRRSPHPKQGCTEELETDLIILAIGQRVNAEGIPGVELTRKQGIVYDPTTFQTSLPGVFAGGDCGNDKITIAVEAVADARKGIHAVCSYLDGTIVPYKPEYLVTRTDITEKTFEDRERLCRMKPQIKSPEQRKNNFQEAVSGYTLEQAVKEAQRCLSCGCGEYYQCKLAEYANQYDVHPDRFTGEVKKTDLEDPHPYVIRDPNKCILCGLCVRVCDEVMGVGALGLTQRGFDTVVLPALGMPLADSGCISCGQCVSVCPTGALQEQLPMSKQIPLHTAETRTICGFCSVGCSQKIQTCGTLPVKAMPDPAGPVNAGVLCKGGKFGFASSYKEENRLYTPLGKTGTGELEPLSYAIALMRTAKSLESVARRYGSDAAAIAVSDRLTLEEQYAAKKLADKLGAKVFSFDNRPCGLIPVLGLSSSPNTMEELQGTDVILAVGFDAPSSQVLRVKLLQAAKAGARVILINPKGQEQEHMSFAEAISTENDLDFLKQIAKALCAIPAAREADGYEAFVASLDHVQVSDQAAEIAGVYGKAKKAMILFQQNVVSEDCAKLLGDIALLSGHIGGPRNGILMVKAKNNSQGLTALGMTAGPEALEGVKGLLILGENPDPDLVKDLDFLAVVDTHLTPIAARADVVFPGTAPIHATGSYLNTERRFQKANAVLKPTVKCTNMQLIAGLAAPLEINIGIWDTKGAIRQMAAEYRWYREASDGEILGNVLAPAKRELIAVEDGAFTDPVPNADYLKELI